MDNEIIAFIKIVYMLSNLGLAICAALSSVVVFLVAAVVERGSQGLNMFFCGLIFSVILLIPCLAVISFHVSDWPLLIPFMALPVCAFSLVAAYVNKHKSMCQGRTLTSCLARVVKMKYVAGWFLLLLSILIVFMYLGALGGVFNPHEERSPDFYNLIVEKAEVSSASSDGKNIESILSALMPVSGISSMVAFVCGFVRLKDGCVKFPDCDSVPVKRNIAEWVRSIAGASLKLLSASLFILFIIAFLDMQDNWSLAAFLASAIITTGLLELLSVLIVINTMINIANLAEWFHWHAPLLNRRGSGGPSPEDIKAVRCRAFYRARALSPAQADELRRSLAATMLPGAVSVDSGNYKTVLAEGRRRDYEALS